MVGWHTLARPSCRFVMEPKGRSDQDSTCWTQIRGAAAGGAKDREEFCHRYGGVIRTSMAARLQLPSDHPDVEDAAQQVFVDLFKDGGALERADPSRTGGFRAFLYGIVCKGAAMAVRKRMRRRELDPAEPFPLEELEEERATLSEVFDRAWAELVTAEARNLMIARAGASDSDRRRLAAMRLRYEEGLPPREIAPKLGIEVREVYRLIEKGRGEYRSALLEIMAGYHPVATEEELEEKCADLIDLL